MRRNIVWVMWYSMALHYVWAVLLCFSAVPLRTAPLSAFADMPRLAVIVIFTASSTLALYALVALSPCRRMRLLCIMPQQILSLMSAMSAIVLIASQHYADGVIRPWAFIAADQCSVVIAAVVHTLAVLEGSWIHGSR